jgi:hypothetical protein
VGVLSDTQLAALLRKVGVSAGDAAYLVATAHPESGANPSSVQQGQPYATTGWGLWQITPGDSEPADGVNQALLNPLDNAKAAKAKLDSQGLGAWTTITGGLYQPYFDAAQTAVSDVYDLPQAELTKLVESADKGGAAGSGGGSGGILGDISSWISDVTSGGGLFTDLENVTDVPHALALVAAPFVKIADALDWFFHPSHWIRLFCGFGGGFLTLGGIWQMSHTSSLEPSSASLPMGIAETGLGALLLFVAFHNLPDTVATFPDFIGYLSDEIRGGAKETASA